MTILKVPKIREELRQRHQDETSDHGAHQRAAAADDDRGNGNDGEVEGKEGEARPHIEVRDIGARQNSR